MALTTQIDLRMIAELTKAVDLGGSAKDALDFRHRVNLSSGTGAGAADVMFYDERTLAASATEDLDLVGALANTFGATFSPARIKVLWFKAEPYDKTAVKNTNDVIIGGASATQWAALLGTTGTVRFRPGACMAFAAGESDATGYVCAAGATDLLKVANSGAGTSVTYQIAVVAASA